MKNDAEVSFLPRIFSSWKLSLFFTNNRPIYISLSLSLSPQESRQNGFVASPTIFFSFCAARFKNPFSLPFSPPGTPVITEGEKFLFLFSLFIAISPPSSLSQHWGRAEEGEGEREGESGGQRVKEKGDPAAAAKGGSGGLKVSYGAERGGGDSRHHS